MKTILTILASFIVFLAALFFADQYNKSHNHPTLNEDARLPDEYFIDAVILNQRGNTERCIFYIEKTIAAMWKLEKDMNEEGASMLEDAIFQLETLHKQLSVKRISQVDLKETYRKVMSILASSEITVAKDLVRAGNVSNTETAIEYAVLHLKNSLLFQQSHQDTLINPIIDKIEAMDIKANGINSKDLISQFDQIISNIKLQWT